MINIFGNNRGNTVSPELAAQVLYFGRDVLDRRTVCSAWNGFVAEGGGPGIMIEKTPNHPGAFHLATPELEPAPRG